MTEHRRYNSATALRTGLEDRLKRIAREEGVDLQRLRRQVAFDRFLARLFQSGHPDWVLKGGYAMELRLHKARTTKDLDFTVRMKPDGGDDAVLAILQDVGAADLSDWFVFRVSEATTDLDGAPYGGARYPVEATMAGRTFVKFHLDVGIGDIVVEPVDVVQAHDWLGFAGIEAARVRMIQSEQQFAEKIHAYTLPRAGAPNSRVRDLVDLALLVGSGMMNRRRVAEALRRTFERRGTHEIPRVLPPPPADWTIPFATMAEECSLNLDAAAAFSEVARSFQQLTSMDE
jgi:predicted nucleotidyltransferase component of viral defense system